MMKFINFHYYKTKAVQFFHKNSHRFFVSYHKHKPAAKMKLQKPFEWRGLMIDTSRHMPSLSWLYKKVDELAGLEMNKLHLHLSDDQGWRVEIKQYPKLQEIAAWRQETVIAKNFPTPWAPFTKYMGDGQRYGGFYAQEDLRKLVAYAKDRGVEIVPEIDLPGHLSALLAAYPEHSAGPAPFAPLSYWGVFPNVLANKKESLQFVKNILDEIMDIFPSRYINLGGDEVPLDNYADDKQIPHKILKELILYVKSKGRTAVVWDEALGVAKETGAVVMAWHSLEAGYEALEYGCEVVFCPTSHCYFDFYQHESSDGPLAIGGFLPLSTVKNFCLAPQILHKYKNKVLGIQANLWTEYMPTEAHMDYMLYPRLEAFAKVAAGK